MKKNISNNADQNDKENSSKPKKGFNFPTLEISVEREEEILNYFADKIIDYGLEVPALLFLTPIRPISPIASQLGLLPFAPLLEAFNISGFDYVAFFRKSENVRRLLEKIEERSRKSKKDKKKESKNK
jgi:hypothetical protein